MAVVLTVPFVGGLADRIGVRKVAIGTLALFGLCFAALAFTPASLLGFYLLWILLGALGGGSTPVTWTRAVNAWFVYNRGLALALTLMGTGLTAAFLPSFATWLIEQYGWRQAFLGIAVLPLLVALPVVIARRKLRRRPVGVASRFRECSRIRARHGAVSTGRCNVLSKALGRGLPSEGLPRSAVEAVGDLVELRLRIYR
jgi:MFS family permease